MTQTRSSRRSSSRSPRKRAFLVGINRYPGAPLKGCVNDALMMAGILIDYFGFQPGPNMRLVVDERATKKAILDRLEWLVSGAKAGDVLVFHYSGHGAQVTDRSGDELDNLDECLCPIDFSWDDPLLDDDLSEICGAVPDGANLTMILDCCHSGTGTRAFGTNHPMTIKRLLPPPDILFRKVASIEVDKRLDNCSVNLKGFRSLNVRRMGSGLANNAILIAGCRSDQLSKDALIDGDFHGALTYSLYEAIKKEGPDQSYADWLELGNQILKGHRIQDQDPQLEAPLELHEWKIFSNERSEPKCGATVRTAVDTHVVYVHGICEHESGYSDGWWRAMKPYLLSVPDNHRHEVLWSQHVTPKTRGRAQKSQKQEDIAEILKDTLTDRAQRQRSDFLVRSTGEEESRESVGDRAFLGIPGLDCVDDFVKYLFDESIRAKVIEEFDKVVKPLLESGSEVEVISHSWGTVVAYEALRLLDDSKLPSGSVHTLFTIGSALSIPLVQRLLLEEANDGARPQLVNRWVNLDARGDIVGGPLRDAPFHVDHEYLGLTPVGCSRLFPSPACAHSSYFHPENQAVNRDIFAKYIRD